MKDNSLLRDCLVAASGPKTVKSDDPDLCFACEGARKVLINMGPGRGVEWHTCKSCDGTGWKKPNYWIMNNFVVFVPIIMANNFVE